MAIIGIVIYSKADFLNLDGSDLRFYFSRKLLSGNSPNTSTNTPHSIIGETANNMPNTLLYSYNSKRDYVIETKSVKC